MEKGRKKLHARDALNFFNQVMLEQQLLLIQCLCMSWSGHQSMITKKKLRHQHWL